MTNSNDQLDRIEDDFETVKEILVAVARRAESTDERLDRLAQRQDRTQQQLDQLEQRQERTQEQLDQLAEDVDIAFQTIKLMTENSDREMAEFRSAILGLQTESHHMWEYLMRRDQDGNGDGSQP